MGSLPDSNPLVNPPELDFANLIDPEDYIANHGETAFADYYRVILDECTRIGILNDSRASLGKSVMYLIPYENRLATWLDNAADYLAVSHG